MNIKDFQNGYVLGLATQQTKEIKAEAYLHTKIRIRNQSWEQFGKIYTSNYPKDSIPIDSTAKGLRFTFDTDNTEVVGTPKLTLGMERVLDSGTTMTGTNPTLALPGLVSNTPHSEEIYWDFSDIDFTDITKIRLYVGYSATNSSAELLKIKISNVEVVY
jgi:hypothetical protein